MLAILGQSNICSSECIVHILNDNHYPYCPLLPTLQFSSTTCSRAKKILLEGHELITGIESREKGNKLMFAQSTKIQLCPLISQLKILSPTVWGSGRCCSSMDYLSQPFSRSITDLKPKLTDSARWVGHQAPASLLCFPVLELQAYTGMSDLHMTAKDPSTESHVYIASSLPAEPTL